MSVLPYVGQVLLDKLHTEYGPDRVFISHTVSVFSWLGLFYGEEYGMDMVSTRSIKARTYPVSFLR